MKPRIYTNRNKTMAQSEIVNFGYRVEELPEKAFLRNCENINFFPLALIRNSLQKFH